jgi:ubiquinone biosynthesis protein
MTNWDFLISQSALATVLPDECAHFRAPIAGALTVFLENLSPTHQGAILVNQAALPASARPAERLAALARNCPSLHKLGQVLARDRRISAELREHFQELESLPPSIGIETIKAILEQELGPLDRLSVTLSAPALAEASVAVVVGFQDELSPPGGGCRDGVFKILKPGIEDRLEEELALFERIGSHLDQRCDDFQIPHLDYRDIFEQVRAKLRLETRLDLEQENLVQARACYSREPRVLIPERFDYCTRHVTAMERVRGEKVTEHGLESASEQDQLARLVVQALIAQPIFNEGASALFHGDPHAGNLFLAQDGRLAILDWSLVGRLRDADHIALVQLVLGALTFDAERIAATLVGLDERQRLDQTALPGIVRNWLCRIRQGHLPGFTWLMGLLDEAVASCGLRVGSDLLLFRKTIHTLEGIVDDIGPAESRIDDVLVGEFLGHFVREWPERWLAPPYSREFATGLSNADLAELWLSWPLTVTRFWLGS